MAADNADRPRRTPCGGYLGEEPWACVAGAVDTGGDPADLLADEPPPSPEPPADLATWREVLP